MFQPDCLQLVAAAFVAGVFYPIVGVALLLFLEQRWEWFHDRMPTTIPLGLLATVFWPAALLWILLAEAVCLAVFLRLRSGQAHGRKAKAA